MILMMMKTLYMKRNLKQELRTIVMNLGVMLIIMTLLLILTPTRDGVTIMTGIGIMVMGTTITDLGGDLDTITTGDIIIGILTTGILDFMLV
ncbi:hypothetical protein D6T69_05145 [Tenacibaculum singaporense]|uniref:Uncharacterized protein n=1 Tax=Tenacibaculum singaporense TaxID=2358479 RepID=A0A3S8R599_9FLAO|nr:hypothetical protein D6T69_05145 [Tenacibaculum singaporense]